MDRKLASIQFVNNIIPIEGSDFIEQIGVLGWKLISKKEEFRINDKCVYFEIDSILPKNDVFSFMEKYHYKVKTIKLRGVYSQGLALPLDLFGLSGTEVGTDVTEQLGIQKWEPPVTLIAAGVKVHHVFSKFVPKTDETRIQSVPDVIEELKNQPYYISLKIDGTSCTIEWDGENFSVFGRNNKIGDKEAKTAYGKIAYEKYNLENRLKELNRKIAIQGEIAGPEIQGNKCGLVNVEFFVFNIFDIESKRYVDFDEFKSIAEKLELKTVPILEEGTCFNRKMTELEDYADSLQYSNGNFAEGIVVRPKKEQYNNELKGRLSFKVVNKKFLLRYE